MRRDREAHEDDSATKDTARHSRNRRMPRCVQGHAVTKVTKHEHEGARRFAPIPAGTELVSSQVIGAAIEVHRALGPGFLEKIYMEALCLELHERRMRFERERAVAVWYRGVAIPGQRIDLIVEECVLVELKATSRLDMVHDAKAIS